GHGAAPGSARLAAPKRKQRRVAEGVSAAWSSPPFYRLPRNHINNSESCKQVIHNGLLPSPYVYGYFVRRFDWRLHPMSRGLNLLSEKFTQKKDLKPGLYSDGGGLALQVS